MTVQIHLNISGQSYKMVARKRPSNRRFIFLPILLVPLTLFSSLLLIRPPSFSQLNNSTTVYKIGSSGELKGSVSEAHRLPSWLREKAIDKLPFYTKSNNTKSNGTNTELDDEVNEALAAAKKYTTSNSDYPTIDVITIGTTSRIDHMHAQQNAWASNKHGVRNVFMATEINTDNAINDDGSCYTLRQACDESFDYDDVEHYTLEPENVTALTESISSLQPDKATCLSRRIGLAIGASVRRYRKLVKTLLLGETSTSLFNVERGNALNDEIIKQYTIQALPDYLVLTFDSVYYNTTLLIECLNGGEEDESLEIYAPSISWTNANLEQSNESSSSTTTIASSFAYPSNNTGVVFNKVAFEMWIRKVTCPETIDDSMPTDTLEYSVCQYMKATTTADLKQSYDRDNQFDDAMSKALQTSLYITNSKKEETSTITKSRNEFEYSSTDQAISISDLLSIYASNVHVLCKNFGMGQRPPVPGVEQMMGYLIHRFGLSHNGLASNGESSCKASSIGGECNSMGMVACSNLTLQELNGI